MTDLRKQIDDAVSFLRTKTDMQPPIGIILGTGLGGLAKEIKTNAVIDYGDIPHFPVSTVESAASSSADRWRQVARGTPQM